MTDEEVVSLIKEVSEEINKLSEPEKMMTRQERTHKVVLQLQLQALEKIKAAKEKGSLHQEARAGVDYVLITKYGEKHPFLMNFIKAQMGWWLGFG